MTIHSGHPFADAPGDRDGARRLRARLAGRVTLWTTGSGPAARAGLTVSSTMVAAGDPALILGLVDPDSGLGEVLEPGARLCVTPLEWRHRALADAFAGVTPAPGGPWRLAEWRHEDGDGPPILLGTEAYALAEVVALEEAGWSTLVRARLEEVRVHDHDGEGADRAAAEPELVHHRGRYRRLAPPGGA